MFRLDPQRLAEGHTEVPGLTNEQHEALIIIGQRIIGLEEDLQQLVDPAHKQVVQNLVQDFSDVSKAVCHGYQVIPERLTDEPEEPFADKLARRIAAGGKRPMKLVRKKVSVAHGIRGDFGPSLVPVTENDRAIVELACSTLRVIYEKAISRNRDVSTEWLEALATDIRDMAELCGVRLTGPEAPGRANPMEVTPWQN